MKLGEFFIDLFVDSSQGELSVSQLVTKMGELEAATLGQLGALFKLGQKLAQFTDISIKMALGLEDYTTLTGESAEALQKWQRVAEHVNIPAEAITKTFMGLSSAAATLKRTGTGPLLVLAEVLRIPIANKGPEQLLNLISKSQTFRLMSPAARTELLEAAQISPIIQRMLLLSAEQNEKYGGLVSGLSDKDATVFAHMASGMSDMYSLAKQIGIEISLWSAGPLQHTIDNLVEGFRMINTFTRKFLTSPAGKLAAFAFNERPTEKESKEFQGSFVRSLISSDVLSSIFGQVLTSRKMKEREHELYAPTPLYAGGASSAAMTPVSDMKVEISVLPSEQFKTEVRTVAKTEAKSAVHEDHNKKMSDAAAGIGATRQKR